MDMVADARELGARALNFFMVRAPKAGTTSVYRYLDQHPQIFAEEMRPENFTDEWKR
jgi:hypothetical protein